ncbi:hypothetical protein V6767_02250 [Martelella sp. FLE1502]
MFIESTGETLHAPALIVVEQDRKLAQTGDDSPMMFNLETDPLKQNNIARAGDALEADLCGENCRSPGLTGTWRMRTRLAAQAHIYPTGDGEERAASSPGFYAAFRCFARRCARCGRSGQYC